MIDRQLLLDIRQALLMMIDTIERLLCITPRTSELRKAQKGIVKDG